MCPAGTNSNIESKSVQHFDDREQQFGSLQLQKGNFRTISGPKNRIFALQTALRIIKGTYWDPNGSIQFRWVKTFVG